MPEIVRSNVGPDLVALAAAMQLKDPPITPRLDRYYLIKEWERRHSIPLKRYLELNLIELVHPWPRIREMLILYRALPYLLALPQNWERNGSDRSYITQSATFKGVPISATLETSDLRPKMTLRVGNPGGSTRVITLTATPAIVQPRHIEVGEHSIRVTGDASGLRNESIDVTGDVHDLGNEVRITARPDRIPEIQVFAVSPASHKGNVRAYLRGDLTERRIDLTEIGVDMRIGAKLEGIGLKLNGSDWKARRFLTRWTHPDIEFAALTLHPGDMLKCGDRLSLRLPESPQMGSLGIAERLFKARPVADLVQAIVPEFTGVLAGA